MAKQESGQAEEEKKHKKKLQRREKILADRLKEAQESYDSAQERLKQAEVRVQRRKESVERLEGRLAFVREQLVENKMVSMREVSSPVVEEEEPLGGAHNEDETLIAVPDAPEEELEEEPVQESVPEEEIETGEPVLEETQEPATEPEVVDTSVTEPVVEGEQESVAEDLEELVAEPMVEEEEPVAEEEVVAQEEKVEELPVEEEQEPIVEPVLEEEEEVVPEEEEVEESVLEEVGRGFTKEIIKVLSESRRLTEMAERAARVAIACTDHLFDHLEQMLNGRYLQLELEQLQGESESLSALARRANKIVEAAIVLFTKVEPEEEIAFLTRELEEQWQVLGQIRMSFENEFGDGPIEYQVEDEGELRVTAESALDMDVDEVVFDLPASAFIHTSVSGEPEEVDRVMPPFPLDVIEEVVNTQIREGGPIEQLNEEEKEVESVAAMLIANAAAAAAAEAEALAEASGQYTREAYATAIQADQLLKQIRAAIQLGTLSGEDADAVLRQVERAATYAHAALADAEAAEERAVSAAINAEAEAEVAEGMAQASQARGEEFDEDEEWATQTDKYLLDSTEALKRARVEADEAEIRKSVS